jgi:hypothetical protein
MPLMWIVRLTDQPGAYGPFDDPASATRFADFLTQEVDPAHIEQLHDPVTELLNWRDAMHAGGHLPARPSVRGGPDIGHEAELDYRDGQDDQ